MAKTIGTILSLTDKVSPKLITIGRNFDSLDKKQQAMAKSAAYQLNNYAKSLGSAATAAAKFAGASALALGGVAVKTGLSEAMGLETYRTQLLTATKDTERAAEVMRYAIDLANKTPFEGADMTSAAAVLEMAGMQTEKYLTLLGDVAAATNREIADVRHGFINAFTVGEYASFREVTGMALNGEMIDEYGRARGIADRAEALYALLNEKFGGGMAALAKTTKGTWATITDVTKNSLANIIGATNEGTVRTGSALDTLKQKATGFADTLVRMQNDGTLDAWSEKIDTGFGKALESAEGLWKLLSNNKEVILGIGGTMIAVNGLAKGITSLGTVLKTAKTLYGAFTTGALGLSPVGILAGVAGVALLSTLSGTAIAQAVGEKGPAINKNGTPIYAADQFNAAADAFDRLKTSADLLTGTLNLLDTAGSGIAGVAISIADFFQGIFDRSKAMLGRTNEKLLETWNEDAATYFEKLWKKISSGFAISPEVDRYFGGDSIAETRNNISSPKRNPNLPTVNIPIYGNGTHYHQGGKALVGDKGPEIVDLPTGSRVYTNNEMRQIFNRGNTTIVQNFHFSGNIDEDKVADVVCGKILEVLDNV